MIPVAAALAVSILRDMLIGRVGVDATLGGPGREPGLRHP